LRLAGAKSEDLARLGSAGGDLLQLYERYQEQLGAFSLADRAWIFQAAAEAAASMSAQRLPTIMVWLDLSLNSRVERRFLTALAERAEKLLVTLPAEADQRREQQRRFERCFEVAGRPLNLRDLDEDPPAGGLTQLERVQRFVFSFESPPVLAAVPEDRSLQFSSAPGEGQECVEIAREARKLAAQGVPYDQMTVLVRSPTTYLPLLEDALRRAEIPAYFSRGTSRPDPAGRALLALLACANEGLSASRFAEYLSLGQVPELDALGAPPVIEIPWVEPQDDQFVLKTVEAVADDGALLEIESGRAPLPAVELEVESPVRGGTLAAPFRWESMLVDAAVVGGSDRWRRRLQGLHRELELRLREAVEDESNRRDGIERQLSSLRHLERFALPVVEQLDQLPEEALWGEWLDHLESLASRTLRWPESVLGLLAELRPMSDVGPVSLDLVQLVLHERLTLLRSSHPRRRYGRILIAALAEGYSHSSRVVFLPGMAEGIFPRRALEDPLLLDDLRHELPLDLATQQDRLARERRLLHIAVGAASERLLISYPRVDVTQGRQRVPSFYALDLLRAAEGRLPPVQALQKRAIEASAIDIGWPAPRDCEDAIDDAEFDLSLLKPLLNLPATETTGHGQFLLRSNPHLARSLRARARRWRRAWHPDDGMVAPGQRSLAELDKQRFSHRSYSPTALQNFAGCPYRFYLQAVVRLRPREGIGNLERLDPLTRGSLFHDTQFEVFADLRDAGLLPVRPANVELVLTRVDAVFDRLVQRYEEQLAPAIPQIWKIEIENLRNDLRGWVRQVAADDWTWQPRNAELAFGLPTNDEYRDSASTADPVEILSGVKLRGSIDLVEQHASGHRYRVTDHKTGRIARDGRDNAIRTGSFVTGGGKILQPLLYAMAAEQLLAVAPDPAREVDREVDQKADLGADQAAGQGAGQPVIVESGRLFYCTQRGGYEVAEVALNQGARRDVADILDAIDKSLSEGFLPAMPAARECSWCDYAPICGPYEETRTRRKKRAALVQLERVRKKR
jgi:hypothetical protein